MRGGLRLLLLLLGGCATAPPMPEPPRTHPAAPAAEASPRVPTSDTLVLPGAGKER